MNYDSAKWTFIAYLENTKYTDEGVGILLYLEKLFGKQFSRDSDLGMAHVPTAASVFGLHRLIPQWLY